MPLHPFIDAMLENMADAPAISEGSPEEARANLAARRDALGSDPEMEKVQDIEIPTRGGVLNARLLVPPSATVGLIVYLHGGGWVLGATDDFDAYARALAAASGCALLLPDYRLAPEYPFPAALEDAEDVLRWAVQDRLGMGADLPLIIAGDSAGANLATVIARKLCETVPLALQVLYYPIADSDFDNDSYRQHGEGLPLTKKDMEWFFGHYAPHVDWTHPDISPLRAEDLGSMPPAVVVTAEYDVLSAEGSAYAAKLRAAKIPVTERCLAGLTHGFVRLHNLLEPAQEELAAVGQDIADACRSSKMRRS